MRIQIQTDCIPIALNGRLNLVRGLPEGRTPGIKDAPGEKDVPEVYFFVETDTECVRKGGFRGLPRRHFYL